MATDFEPPPTYADVVLYDKDGTRPRFNPIWLKWFVDLAAFISASGGGGGGVDHNLTTNLQGGTANQYYHLTSAQQSALTAGFTGTGNIVRETSPTLVTPALGTPTALVATNATGTAAGLTAGLTTNTVSKTGTGSTYATSTSPVFTTPVLGTATGTKLTLATAAAVVATSVNLTDGAGVAAGTLLTAPAAGNPTKWIGIDDNGTIRYVPAW